MQLDALYITAMHSLPDAKGITLADNVLTGLLWEGTWQLLVVMGSAQVPRVTFGVSI